MKELADKYLGCHVANLSDEEQDDVRRLLTLRWVRLEGLMLIAPGPTYVQWQEMEKLS